MRTKNPGRFGSLCAAVTAGVLLLLTLSGCGTGNNGTPDAGSPSSFSALPSPATTAAPGSARAVPPTSSPSAAPAMAEPAVLTRSEPVTLEIQAIGLQTDLLKLGLRENGSLEVPQDSGNGAPAGWYDGSPTPGERGPSVILGHVNALGGATGVFADLRKLTPGTDVKVSRADGTMAVFTVDHGAQYSKNDFPTLEVYGTTPGAELRLITCDGYDPATQLFDDNYVIFAKLRV
ncbi:sortase domain-bontaining protein [Arthrobacter sp. B3I4]|uniref:sortase domain-containing protein n=1 Tax=Arthrobacter sp. B3I4 TaxID=3042267 RepID=UPI00277FE7E9|nr:sortase [Arthrobacter sp. B3I4]MDQ0755196.1 hypothetical protein [Arthrobacter sp. B3I4]